MARTQRGPQQKMLITRCDALQNPQHNEQLHHMCTHMLEIPHQPTNKHRTKTK
jgi:hypothetical protein